VLIGGGDPPDPDQAGFEGTVYMVQVCKEHDPDPPAVDAAPETVYIGADRPTRTLGELLIDLEEDKAARVVVFGLLAEMEREHEPGSRHRSGGRRFLERDD
jgi:hypothetical protein